jgi:hypothetical protein
MPPRLTPQQIALQVQNSRLRRRPNQCNRCGGHHAGECQLVYTSRGTLARVEIIEKVEARYKKGSE